MAEGGVKWLFLFLLSSIGRSRGNLSFEELKYFFFGCLHVGDGVGMVCSC